MSNLKFFLKLSLALFKRFKAVVFIGVILGIILFFLIRIVFPIISEGKTERIAMTGRFHSEQLPQDILRLISGGLTQLNESGTPEPDLASSWESPDKGKTWIFHLKESSWQDGQPVTSSSVVYEFSDVEVEKPDDKTIIFKLKDPYAPFPSVVAKPTFRRGLLGTGEWKVKKVLVTAGFIRDITLVNSNKDKKIYKFYPTTERTKFAFKLGEVDTIEKTLDPFPFDSWNTANISEVQNENQVVTLFFNTQDVILAEKSVRQALTYAINKNPLGARAVSPISPNSWSYNPQVKTYSYEVDRAKELLEELPLDFKNKLEIKLVSTPALLSTAEAIAKDWEAVGVKTTVQVSSIIPSEFQAYLTIFEVPHDPDQYSIWHSTQDATNISRYSSPRVDKLLEDGRSELDLEERRKIYLDFQRFLLEDIPAAFLYHPTYYTITRK